MILIMGKFINLENKIFGRLTVLNRAPNRGRRTVWTCQCICGNTVDIGAECLSSGTTKSCGCLHAECVKLNSKTHGLRNTHEYNVWCWMKARCYNPNDSAYENYGGRGITVCDRWLHDPKAFYEDMGPRPSVNHSIDRINNNGPYSPENCRWATRTEQNNNTRNNVLYTINGISLTIKDWAKRLDLDRTTIYWRLRNGWSLEEALETRFMMKRHS